MKLLLCLRYIFGIWVLILLWPIPISHATDSDEEPRLPLAMEVFLKKPKKHQYEIHIHLTNISPESVTVDVHDLPWIPPNDSKWLVAYRTDATNSPIEQTFWPGAFGSQAVRLLPGESIQGELPLNPRIPSLLKDIDQFGIQLQWDCPPPSLKFMCKTDSRSSITISKKDPGLPDVYSFDQNACRKLEHTIGLISIPQDHDVLFLLTTEAVVADLQRVQSLLLQVDEYVQQCKPTWTNSWAVSFFTDKKFAGFLRDEENQLHFERGLWQQANIGQYSSQIRALYRFPWIRKKADTIYLSVYGLRENGKTKLGSPRVDEHVLP